MPELVIYTEQMVKDAWVTAHERSKQSIKAQLAMCREMDALAKEYGGGLVNSAGEVRLSHVPKQKRNEVVGKIIEIWTKERE